MQSLAFGEIRDLWPQVQNQRGADEAEADAGLDECRSAVSFSSFIPRRPPLTPVHFRGHCRNHPPQSSLAYSMTWPTDNAGTPLAPVDHPSLTTRSASMYRQCIVGLIATGVLAAGCAGAADDSGFGDPAFYVGFGVGEAHNETGDFRLDGPVAKAFAGYAVNDYFAAEVAYVDPQDAHDTIGDVRVGLDVGSTRRRSTATGPDRRCLYPTPAATLRSLLPRTPADAAYPASAAAPRRAARRGGSCPRPSSAGPRIRAGARA